MCSLQSVSVLASNLPVYHRRGVIAEVCRLLGAYFNTIFHDIHTSLSIADRAAASSQFIREFGQAPGGLHNATPLMSLPAEIRIPSLSLFDRENVGSKHDLEFIQGMFQHLPIGNNLYESNQTRYIRSIHIITLTEGQIRTYHRDNYSLNKGLAVNSIWLTHDLIETVFHRWYQNAVDTFFTPHPDYRANLSALMRDEFPHDLMLFAEMCTRLFPDSLPDPLTRCPAHLIPTRIRADRTPYISQQLEQFEDHDDTPRVEQLDDVEFELEERHADNHSKAARIRKFKYSDLSERSLMSQGDSLPDISIKRVREEFSWDLYGSKHLYVSESDIEGAGRGAFMCHQVDIEQFLGWYTDPPIPQKASGHQNVDDDSSETITAYRYHDDDAGVYRDAWDPKNLRPT